MPEPHSEIWSGDDGPLATWGQHQPLAKFQQPPSSHPDCHRPLGYENLLSSLPFVTLFRLALKSGAAEHALIGISANLQTLHQRAILKSSRCDAVCLFRVDGASVLRA